MKKAAANKRRAETITPYELQRLKNCMRNKARIEALGLHTTRNEFDTMALMKSARASKGKDPEHSESEYAPGDDPSGEGHESDDSQTESTNKTARNKTGSKRTSDDMSAAGTSPRAAKRAAPAVAQPTTRLTRSQKAAPARAAAQPTTRGTRAAPPASRSSSGVTIHPTSLIRASVWAPPVSPAKSVNNVEQPTQHCPQDEATQQQDDQVPLTPDEHAAGDECAEAHNEVQTEEVAAVPRGQSMGKGLQKMTRARHGKLPLVIQEGKARPVLPVVAAKFATECNITVRNHLPVFKHWKEYKKHPALLEQFMGSLKLKFDMNTDDGSVQNACNLMMKSALRQQ